MGGIQGVGTSLTFNFGGKKEFKFDIAAEMEQQKLDIQNEINCVDTSQFDLNEMVMNYLSHNCYIKTLLSLKDDLNYDSSVDCLLEKDEIIISDKKVVEKKTPPEETHQGPLVGEAGKDGQEAQKNPGQVKSIDNMALEINLDEHAQQNEGEIQEAPLSA